MDATLRRRLEARFGEGLQGPVRQRHDETEIRITAAQVPDVLRTLYDEPDFQFQLLADLAGVDTGTTMQVVYHLWSTTSGDWLRVIMTDPQLAWLRPLSELIVRIDLLLDVDADDVAPDVVSVLAQARALMVPDEGGSVYARRYHTALQDHPDAVFAHRDVTASLKQPGLRETLH